MSAADAPLVVAFPERLDRTLRLGPFPSARDALRLLTYAAVGACLAPFAPADLWLGVVGFGFVSSVWKPGGETVEAQTLRTVSWGLRRLREGRPMTQTGSSGPRTGPISRSTPVSASRSSARGGFPSPTCHPRSWHAGSSSSGRSFEGWKVALFCTLRSPPSTPARSFPPTDSRPARTGRRAPGTVSSSS